MGRNSEQYCIDFYLNRRSNKVWQLDPVTHLKNYPLKNGANNKIIRRRIQKIIYLNCNGGGIAWVLGDNWNRVPKAVWRFRL